MEVLNLVFRSKYPDKFAAIAPVVLNILNLFHKLLNIIYQFGFLLVVKTLPLKRSSLQRFGDA